MTGMAKVILAGGSGFLGQALGRRLAADGWDVVVLSRQPRAGAPFREVAWDAENAGAWTNELSGAAAVVNFAGRSINCVHTPANRRAILASRVNAVRALAQGWVRVANPPPVWVQCSATGYYGDAGDRVCTEAAPAGDDFLAEVCRHWEQAFAVAELPGVRRVVLRLGVVLDAEHGALPPLARLARRFLGGAAGNGRQFMSWVHRDDAITAFVAALTRADFTGTFNLCAPAPVTNAEFMRTLRSVLGRPWSPPAPAFAVRLMAGPLMGVDPALALHGQRAVPRRLQAAGFSFAHPELVAALRDLLNTK
jgi:uncharacterized protein (TIGR01777 family)